MHVNIPYEYLQMAISTRIYLYDINILCRYARFEKDGRNGLNVTHERQVCVARLIGPDRWEHAIPLHIRSVPSALMPPNWIYMPRVLDGGQIGCTWFRSTYFGHYAILCGTGAGLVLPWTTKFDHLIFWDPCNSNHRQIIAK